jgi:hypothetical protein
VDLSAFDRRLRELIGEPTLLRPFVCQGSPLDCKAFIVGSNPATTFEADFWTFWRPGYGFDKKAWLKQYVDERGRRPLKPGKTRRSPISNTRRVIEWVLEGASPLRCLETNVFAAPAESIAELGDAQRVSEPFDFLLEAIKPDILVAHGKDAIAHLSKRHVDCSVIEAEHFSRGWSRQGALNLGQRLKG